MTDHAGSPAKPTGYTMTTARVRDLSAALSHAADDLQERLDELDGELSRLEPAWTGEASRAYHSAQREWAVSMARLKTLLAEAGVRSGRALDRHLEARERVKGLWK